MGATRASRIGATLALGGLVVAAWIVAPGQVAAVETDMTINTTAIDFGQVNVGSTAEVSVTLTNTGGDPFGPITMFGGAPPTAEFDASQNCQSKTLPAGGSCTVNYEFSPGSVGSFNDTSSFTISETNSQSQGEDFNVNLAGVGFDPNVVVPTLIVAPTLVAVPTVVADPAGSTTTTTDTSTTTTSPDTTTTSVTNGTDPAGDGSSDDPSGGTATTIGATASSTTTVLREVLTGAALDPPRPALVVKIDNVDAEPQSGLNQADLVFEEIVEGQATRFAAVFHSTDANPVGPVRSARTQDVDLLQSLNDPALAYSGANEGVDVALQAAGFELLSEGNPGFFRRDDREAPHNLYVNLAALWPQLTSSGNAVPAFDYVAPGAEPIGTPVTFAQLMVGGYDVRWDWDATQRLFLRSQLGSPHELTDGRANANTVVVLVVEYGTSPAGGGPEAQTVGSGAAVVYTAGVRIEGTWTRQSPTDPFRLESAGQPILIAPGRTWVELVDAQHNLTDG